MYACMYMYTYICVFICMYICMFICVYVCMYVCMYYMCVCVCVLKLYLVMERNIGLCIRIDVLDSFLEGRPSESTGIAILVFVIVNMLQNIILIATVCYYLLQFFEKCIILISMTI
jgi:hypothetical protein